MVDQYPESIAVQFETIAYHMVSFRSQMKANNDLFSMRDLILFFKLLI